MRNRRSVAIVLVGTMLSFVVGVVGCESTPLRTLRGARHYTAGSDALARHDGDFAIRELEQAATLVPHGSEIQNHLGLAYWSKGREVAARIAFERALALDCENRAAEINLQELMTLMTLSEVSEAAESGENRQAEGSHHGG